MKRFSYIFLTLLIMPLFPVKSQTIPEKFIQLSGIITDVTFKPVSGVSVISRKLRRATVSENTGIYSITTTPGDTVFFRALGYKRYHTVIPENYDQRHCNVDIVLEADTINISEVTILPWRNYAEFLKEMTKETPVNPIIENMNENIASIYVAVNNQTGVSITPEAGFRYAMEQNFSSMATRGQYPVNNLLNPFAWAKFVTGIKNGLLKNHSFKKPEPARVAKKKKKTSSK